MDIIHKGFKNVCVAFSIKLLPERQFWQWQSSQTYTASQAFASGKQLFWYISWELLPYSNPRLSNFTWHFFKEAKFKFIGWLACSGTFKKPDKIVLKIGIVWKLLRSWWPARLSVSLTNHMASAVFCRIARRQALN